MTKYCVGGTLTEPGQTRWEIPTSPGAQRACIDSGGTVVEESASSGCGSTKSTQHESVGGNPAHLMMIDSTFASALRVRDALAGTDLVSALDFVNEAEETPGIISDNPSISTRLAEAVAILSSFSHGLLSGATSGVAGLPYDKELHDWLTALAGDLRDASGNEEVHAAIDHVVEQLGRFVGTPVGEAFRSLRAEASPRSA